ncbi:ranBP-type and C3HC4-type zinc finger-containing protein 1 isoform X2 [Denticeps clupeoides]|uniref:ranBP-type and C3HC4-type zinc finger-containing protein 1 isoform X2 n=1 Tax=Denticeps clupeoides TaxID=299321 RepID=UPI0010A3883B|nr:ranBP-type and C3HC4-type zinc finger-containing protein 1 isoform X2 [Denticeps clupeoides]
MATPDVPARVEEGENLAKLLSEAIGGGDAEEARRCAAGLSALRLPVDVALRRGAYSQEPVRLKVGVEDAQSDVSIPITLTVTAGMTISDLKLQITKDFGFDPTLQTWVVGRRLAQDTDTLYSHGIRHDDDQAFLFIKSAKAAHLSREQHKQEEENRRLEAIIANIELQPRGTQAPRLHKPKLIVPPPVRPKPQIGWSCSQCTFLNIPTRPGCEICSGERPANYEVPKNYQPGEAEVRRLQQEQAIENERQRNFDTLLETDSQSLVPNSDELECPICYATILPGEGATLRECLHSFCRECLKGTIINNADAAVTCPYMDDDYSCDVTLQDREIRSLLSEEEYHKFLEISLSIAESRAPNSYHCKTPDCAGWCIFEDEVNEFQCQICLETNCLLCKAIHKDMNCKEYQDDLRLRAENDLAAKQTTEMLQTLLQNGEAMHCPRCKVIVQKKDGCDWICCLMCKTEICWVTKQARWGLQGSGDTSGGCRCRVNGVLCHPNCRNCH